MKILYEDNHVIVCYKEYGMLSQPDISCDTSILDEVKKYVKIKYNKPNDVYIGLVHRLDRNTEGIMVFARTSKAAKRLSEDIKTGIFTKKYFCICEGSLDSKGVFIDYLLKDEKNKIAYESKNGKYAKLSYSVIAETLIDNKVFSICDVLLETGRFHQIRYQFAKRGHPLCGDTKYGSLVKSNRPFLQAYSLTFMHPVKKEKMCFEYIDFNDNFKELKNAIECNN